MEAIKEKVVNFITLKGLDILVSIAIVVVGLIIIKFLMSTLKKILKKSKLDPICHKFVVSFTKITLYVLVFIIACSNLGVPMTSLVTVLGAAGLAIGLAVQDSLSNLAGGFILLFTKPFQVGDFIELSGITGTVSHINILQTKLQTVDNKAIYIPNGQVSTDKIINYSREENRRLDLVFSIGYEDDFVKVEKLINNIIENNPLAIKDPEPVVRVCEFAAHSINIAVKVWVKTEDYWTLNYDLLESIKLAFDKNAITIPFNQLDVHIKDKG